MLTPDTSLTLWICDSARPQIHGGGCCNDKGSERLIAHAQRVVAERGLADRVTVVPSSCMANCPYGVSVRVQPGRVCYSQVKPSDIDEILTAHLFEGKPVARLLSQEMASRQE